MYCAKELIIWMRLSITQNDLQGVSPWLQDVGVG